jgi:hypothetical protein
MSLTSCSTRTSATDLDDVEPLGDALYLIRYLESPPALGHGLVERCCRNFNGVRDAVQIALREERFLALIPDGIRVILALSLETWRIAREIVLVRRRLCPKRRA